MSLKSDLTGNTQQPYSSIQEKALTFAVLAHRGQLRKSEGNKPRVLHPIEVANIIREYFSNNNIVDDNVIAAAYLHDIVEDTKYTNQDLKKIFGDDIAHLVEVASEPNKDLTWEERKAHTIQAAKDRTMREKLVMVADKTNNIEDIYKIFQRKRI